MKKAYRRTKTDSSSLYGRSSCVISSASSISPSRSPYGGFPTITPFNPSTVKSLTSRCCQFDQIHKSSFCRIFLCNFNHSRIIVKTCNIKRLVVFRNIFRFFPDTIPNAFFNPWPLLHCRNPGYSQARSFVRSLPLQWQSFRIHKKDQRKVDPDSNVSI